jgi:histone H3/H4
VREGGFLYATEISGKATATTSANRMEADSYPQSCEAMGEVNEPNPLAPTESNGAKPRLAVTLPKASVRRLAAGAVGPGTRVGEDATLRLRDILEEHAKQIAVEAGILARRAGRVTVNDGDIVQASASHFSLFSGEKRTGP